MDTVKDFWCAVLDDLRLQLSSTSISTWFDEVVPVALEGSVLSLYCPSSFKRERLEQFYLQYLKNVLAERFSHEVTVRFLTEAEYTLTTNRQNPMQASDKFTFETFVTGSSNQLAFRAAQNVAAGNNEYCNPLVIYGNPGLGKTHLLRAIASFVGRNAPETRIVSIRGDEFTNEFIEAIRSESNAQFREKYRTATLFLMDDAQFIAGKKQTQLEFYNTFDTLYQNGCSIVLTMDRPPRELDRLDERIASRFEGGLVAEIEEPEYDTRLEIIFRKAEERGLVLSPSQADYIATNMTGSIRRIEGLLNKLKAFGDTAQLEKIVDGMTDGNTLQESAEEVIDRVARAFRVDPAQVRGKNLSRSVAAARQAAMYVLCHRLGLSTVRIGKLFGRDHSTVVYALQRAEEKMKSDERFANALKKLIEL